MLSENEMLSKNEKKDKQIIRIPKHNKAEQTCSRVNEK